MQPPSDDSKFRSFYEFVFAFGCEKGARGQSDDWCHHAGCVLCAGQKSLPIEVARPLWSMVRRDALRRRRTLGPWRLGASAVQVLKGRFPHLDAWDAFLADHKLSISKDTVRPRAGRTRSARRGVDGAWKPRH